MARDKQQSMVFQCPPVFLVSDEGFTILLSDIGPMLLDDDGNVLYELAVEYLAEHKFQLDHIKSRVGRA